MQSYILKNKNVQKLNLKNRPRDIHIYLFKAIKRTLIETNFRSFFTLDLRNQRTCPSSHKINLNGK